MPSTVREYLYAFLISATVVLLIAGSVAVWVALSFQGYLIAAAILAIAGLANLGARWVKPVRAAEDLDAFTNYIGGKRKN